MPQLILVRHAKSDYPLGVADFDRPLAKRGLREAPLMGPVIARWLAAETCVDVWISQAQRTQQTWQNVVGAMGDERESVATLTEHYESDLYEASVGQIAQVISNTSAGCSAIVIGHNPGLQQVMCDYASEGPVRDQAMMRFPTSTLVRLEWEGHWSEFPMGRLTAMEIVTARPAPDGD